MSWSSTSGVSVAGGTGTVTLAAVVSPATLTTVPAGTFLAFPVVYTETVTRPGGTTTGSWTEYFVPYIGNVKVDNPSYTLEVFAFATACGTVFVPPPVITEVEPSVAPPGSTIAISGYQFGTSQGASVLKIGGITVTDITSWTNSSIQCVIPADASTGAIVLTTDTWTGNGNVSLTVNR